MRLEQFGWAPFFAQAYRRFGAGTTPARVCSASHGLYHVMTEAGELTARVTGRYSHQKSGSSQPVTGDWVLLDRDAGLIVDLLPRRTRFSRKRAGSAIEEQVLAANVDVVIVVTGLDRDFNTRRMERYLLLAWESGARPVVLLNKADLVADPGPFFEQARAVAQDAPVLLTSALTGAGMEALGFVVGPGETAVLLGSSGAGKSSLVNHLLGYEARRVNEVRPSDGKGRHTTTDSLLTLLPQGWLLLDTPGLRELQLWSDGSGMAPAFADIEAAAARCRFRDCRHESEPGCAVHDAIGKGRLDPSRLASYHKLARELDHFEAQQNPRIAQRRKQRDKRIHKELKAIYKKR